MKVRWSIAAFALALFAAFGAGAGTLYAQEHDHEDHGEHHDEHGDHHEHHWDEHHPQFDDHEHVVVNSWWVGHRERPVVGFREEDRLRPEWEPRLQVGFVFDRDWRARCRPVPEDLLVELPPPPRHYRYYIVGGHVVLVDRGWRVADVININF
jgi:Ni/Co efflux regulator RcnB